MVLQGMLYRQQQLSEVVTQEAQTRTATQEKLLTPLSQMADELQAALAASAAERHVMPHIEGIPVLPPIRGTGHQSSYYVGGGLRPDLASPVTGRRIQRTALGFLPVTPLPGLSRTIANPTPSSAHWRSAAPLRLRLRFSWSHPCIRHPCRRRHTLALSPPGRRRPPHHASSPLSHLHKYHSPQPMRQAEPGEEAGQRRNVDIDHKHDATTFHGGGSPMAPPATAIKRMWGPAAQTTRFTVSHSPPPNPSPIERDTLLAMGSSTGVNRCIDRRSPCAASTNERDIADQRYDSHMGMPGRFDLEGHSHQLAVVSNTTYTSRSSAASPLRLKHADACGTSAIRSGGTLCSLPKKNIPV
nr:unnamed protein product [Digitaria exilis]